MRMARVNVYLPNDLAAEAKAAGLNVSNLTQEVLRSVLAARSTDGWLDGLASMPSTGIDHAKVVEAVEAAKDEIESHARPIDS
jgi:post-segregation antitoxin (ccd killing protein)